LPSHGRLIEPADPCPPLYKTKFPDRARRVNLAGFHSNTFPAMSNVKETPAL